MRITVLSNTGPKHPFNRTAARLWAASACTARRPVVFTVRRMGRKVVELKYWREIWRKARRFTVNLSEQGWCNYWHQHFDWESRGKRSRFDHRKHIRPLMHAFVRAQRELANQTKPYQLYVSIHPSDPGSDALYVHTPNPHTEFPEAFDHCRFISSVPPLLMGLVNPDRYRIGVSEYEGVRWYTIIPK